MSTANKSFTRRFSLAILATVLIALCGRGCKNTKTADQPATTAPAQLTFSSADDAVNALVTAMRAHDADQLQKIFGADSDDLLNSGDPVADKNAQDKFLAMYDEKHHLVTNAEDSMTLDVGNDDWPMPIPIAKGDDGKWAFDTDTGKNEIINRRVGNNELNVIEVCQAICDAQKEYAQLDPDHDGVPEYARKFVSDPGTRNGLFWETAEGEKPSPLGPLVAEAQGEGYATTPRENDEPRPYHGYLYRIITAQGPNATGGAIDYVINGKLLGGFAVVAWPADYGNSGIMTFVANFTGDVYQKDLGDGTDKLARAMTTYDPDSSWKKAE